MTDSLLVLIMTSIKRIKFKDWSSLIPGMGEIGDLQVSDDVIAELAPTKVWSLLVSFSAIMDI